MVASATSESWQLYALWIAGGFASLCGALCYAELASMFPQSGGDVVYLSKAYGRWAGFLFGWLQTFVARPGDTSLLAFVFARYATPQQESVPLWPAVAAVVFLTVVNIIGLKLGKTMQNVLTVSKVIGLLAIVAMAWSGNATEASVAMEATVPAGPSIGVALILVLFTFGGWNEMVYVASEVEQPERNVGRALIYGTLTVLGIYLLTNFAFVHALSLRGLAASQAIATDAVAHALPQRGQWLVSVVIAISCAGSLNGLILTGARITGAMQMFPPFGWIGAWNDRTGTPVRALILQGVIAIAVILWTQTFENALIYTAAAVYTFYLATGLAVAVLRFRYPDVPRPFRVPWFPLPLIVFAAASMLAIWSAVDYKPHATVICFGILAVGLCVYGVSQSQAFGRPHEDR